MSIYDEIKKGIKLPKREVKEDKHINYKHKLTKEEMAYLNNSEHNNKLVKLYLADHLIYL